jgi:hypothetical protein
MNYKAYLIKQAFVFAPAENKELLIENKEREEFKVQKEKAKHKSTLRLLLRGVLYGTGGALVGAGLGGMGGGIVGGLSRPVLSRVSKKLYPAASTAAKQPSTIENAITDVSRALAGMGIGAVGGGVTGGLAGGSEAANEENLMAYAKYQLARQQAMEAKEQNALQASSY